MGLIVEVSGLISITNNEVSRLRVRLKLLAWHLMGYLIILDRSDFQKIYCQIIKTRA